MQYNMVFIVTGNPPLRPAAGDSSNHLGKHHHSANVFALCSPGYPEFSSGPQTHAPRCGSSAWGRMWNRPSLPSRLELVCERSGPTLSGSVHPQNNIRPTPGEISKQNVCMKHMNINKIQQRQSNGYQRTAQVSFHTNNKTVFR